MALHDEYLWPADFAMDARNRAATASWVSGAAAPPKQPAPMHPIPHQTQRGYPISQAQDHRQHYIDPSRQYYSAVDNSQLPQQMPPRHHAQPQSQMLNHLTPYEEVPQPPARQPPQSALWQRQRIPTHNNFQQPPASGGFSGIYNTFTGYPSVNEDIMDKALQDCGPGSGHTDALSKGRSSILSSVSEDLNSLTGPAEPLPPAGLPYASNMKAESVPYAPSSRAERLPYPMHSRVETTTTSMGPSHPVLSMDKSVGMLGGGAIQKNKQRRRYAKPKSSRYCHLCARHERAVKMHPCGNLDLGICQKSVCEKCFDVYGLDLAAARAPRVPGHSMWTCPHCQNNCPSKAKCHAYDRQTERRRMKTRAKKLGLLHGMQGGGGMSMTHGMAMSMPLVPHVGNVVPRDSTST